MPSFHFIVPGFVFALFAMLAHPAFAFEEINKSYFGGTALGGYDAVSYFIDAKPIKGDQALAFEWKGATWHFSSVENRKRFAAQPEAYAPQYGGYCSNQMSLGNLSDIDAQVWRIIDNKLYLFGHEAGRVRWASETPRHISIADQYWREYLAN